MYSGYGITFESKVPWSFDNDIARNVIVFNVDNSSSSQADSRKSNSLVQREGPTFNISGRFGSPEKIISINFSKATTKFC